MMTPRERILGTFLGEKVDRAPYGVGIGFWPWGEAMERWKRESGIADLDIVKFFGYEPGFAFMPINMGAWPPFKPEVLKEDDETIITRDPRGIVCKNLKKSFSMPDFIDYPVHNRAEWEKYKEERLQPDVARTVPQARLRLEPLEQRPLGARDGPGGGGARGPAGRPREPADPGGHVPMGRVRHRTRHPGAEELLIAFYTDPAMVHDIMDTFTDLWVHLYEQVAPHLRIDHIHIWEDMSGKQGSLISPAMIEEFMMPNYRKIRDFARSHGVSMISVDSDGLVDELIPPMMQNGMNVMFPFEVQAGCDIEKYRRLYPTLGIWGGLNKHCAGRGPGGDRRRTGQGPAHAQARATSPAWTTWCPPTCPGTRSCTTTSDSKRFSAWRSTTTKLPPCSACRFRRRLDPGALVRRTLRRYCSGLLPRACSKTRCALGYKSTAHPGLVSPNISPEP